MQVAIRRGDQPPSDELDVQSTAAGAIVRRHLLGNDGKRLPGRCRRLLSSCFLSASTLAQLVNVLKRIEDLSHILLWGPLEEGSPATSSTDEAQAETAEGDVCPESEELPLDLIELPRLRASAGIEFDTCS